MSTPPLGPSGKAVSSPEIPEDIQTRVAEIDVKIEGVRSKIDSLQTSLTEIHRSFNPLVRDRTIRRARELHGAPPLLANAAVEEFLTRQVKSVQDELHALFAIRDELLPPSPTELPREMLLEILKRADGKTKAAVAQASKALHGLSLDAAKRESGTYIDFVLQYFISELPKLGTSNPPMAQVAIERFRRLMEDPAIASATTFDALHDAVGRVSDEVIQALKMVDVDDLLLRVRPDFKKICAADQTPNPAKVFFKEVVDRAVRVIIHDHPGIGDYFTGNQNVYDFLIEALRNNPEFAMAAIRQNGMALPYPR